MMSFMVRQILDLRHVILFTQEEKSAKLGEGVITRYIYIGGFGFGTYVSRINIQN